MDYILSSIQKHTKLHETGSDERKKVEFYRLEVEYACFFLLAYLWNKNLDRLDEDGRESVFRDIHRPTIGTIVGICRTLDIDREFFGTGKSWKLLDKYPKLRNFRIGHGFIFDDAISTVVEEFRSLSKNILADHRSILSESFDLILVTGQTDDRYSGIRFSADGNSFTGWLCQKVIYSFQLDNVYAVRGVNDYLRISPFIVITPEHDFYLFRDITDRMLGRTTYNQVLKTGSIDRIWTDFTDNVSNDGVRRRSVNGTILNVYKNNHNQYIDVGTKRPIRDFLIKNKASVCATVWGHGGVGKTATVQSICEDLSRSVPRSTDYIVFASAKDRAFNYHSGAIATIEEPIDSYHSLLRCINATIGCSDMDKEDGIVKFEGRMLLVIDDYETFPKGEKEKIEQLIRSLNINHHKVLLTTRANVIIGDEFPTHELSEDNTIKFLKEIMASEFPEYTNRTADELGEKALRQSVFTITNGRPLFIFQLAHIWVQSGSLSDAVHYNIKDQEEAIEFLYGRIYSYLSEVGRDLFRAIGLLITESDMSNLISKLRFIVNMKNDDARFNQGMRDLVKLRIIEIFENGFFSVYSVDILRIMRNEYDKAKDGWRGNVNRRLLRITRDKKTDTEHALLENANTAKYSRSEAEVVDLYREILKRDSSPKKIRSQALLNLTDYMFNYRSKKEEAVSVFREYEHTFSDDPSVIRMYANYCWAERHRAEAIRILNGFFVRSGRKWKANTNTELELRGLSLMYRSIVAIERKEELKVSRNIGEISGSQFTDRNRDVRQEFKIIHDREGVPLFQRVRKTGLDSLSAAARQNVVTGLYNFCDVCMRLEEYKTACDVCNFAI